MWFIHYNDKTGKPGLSSPTSTESELTMKRLVKDLQRGYYHLYDLSHVEYRDPNTGLRTVINVTDIDNPFAKSEF